MLDLKTFKSALEQLEEERKIPKEKILDAIEAAMAAAYKKDYGKRGQIIRAKFDLETGKTEFFQIKIVVDESIAKLENIDGKEKDLSAVNWAKDDERVHFNGEHHILLEDAKKIKKGVELNDEIIFPLETKEDYGRIAAQTAKQVIIQKIREAERTSIIDEYGTKEGEIVAGIVQKMERGNAYVDFSRATGILPAEEQIPGEYLERGARVRTYLYSVEDTPRGINLRLSRTHPKFIEKLFAQEAPEIKDGVVEIKSIAREPGSRSKIAVHSSDEHIDPVGSCVGQKGTRVNTVTNELGGEKIDIIPWSADPKIFVTNALSPAKVLSIDIDEAERKAIVEVSEDQLSLAIGKGGQNVRLAAKLTGWRIDIKGDKKEEQAVKIMEEKTEEESANNAAPSVAEEKE
ncbi:transcription termination factor NusA [Candidatus Nomurabacteria bacterium RIFCSPHIGHO2_02_FULL_41_18]|uniref:Transcription termination/antitermination protein NusA n=1 Tax=Candidatus Nomurabacteria bacterium RIFCSPHIGHO2_02_FULL_41_18 TaxID=1801754 RepID=A0A1F6W532_9BACT|nr:MAG: transcription termination factor NusA [Candidatus Nomurabacteria bacterium RIFCSPHIGHO2_01_FULL_41_71]OGI76954.1 MAG: transcription termination factor NusA [Candidatus Nomurabacteria bacterium RIFCSPHIGHO2_02_FULL_41_18]OGI89464.1 MAG: transcription termination factor NusA [Candidatus Nomurabacteria bacterium RIFCSPLOWO2_01_FULL_41_52b]OGJ00492.1 MAG: transcription termination factor NusA [Candidatus Nomurabacteria bacterium RIFCSPLOWO2_02_FULL_41_9]